MKVKLIKMEMEKGQQNQWDMRFRRRFLHDEFLYFI